MTTGLEAHPAGFHNPLFGIRVTRAAADIFTGAAANLYTVAGGRILLTHFEMEVTAANVDATASNTKITSNPTVGTDTDLCAVLDVTGDVIGTIYAVTGVLATAMQSGLGAVIGLSHKGYIVPEGTIDVNSTADAGTGGALITCEAWYIPLDSGATLATA